MSLVTSVASVSFSASGLPPGLHLSQTGPKTATVSGIAPARGRYTLSITATAGTIVFRRTYTLSVGGVVSSSPGINQN